MQSCMLFPTSCGAVRSTDLLGGVIGRRFRTRKRRNLERPTVPFRRQPGTFVYGSGFRAKEMTIMKLSPVSLGMAIEQILKDADMTAAVLAEKISITTSSLSRTINGLRAVELAEADLIAQVTGKTVDDLLNLARMFERDGHVRERINAMAVLDKSLRRVDAAASRVLKKLRKGGP